MTDTLYRWDAERCEYIHKKTGEGTSIGLGDNVKNPEEEAIVEQWHIDRAEEEAEWHTRMEVEYNGTP